LSPFAVIKRLFIWQIFTHMWLHGGVGHLLFNMLVLWMTGYAVEARLGRRHFWTFYIVCGLVGGLCALGADVLFNWGLDPRTKIVGASGAIYGVLIAFALMYPDALFLFMFFIPVRARTAAYILAGIQVLYAMLYDVAAIGHLGGMLAGYLLLKGEDPLRYFLRRLRPSRPFGMSRQARRRPERSLADDEDLQSELDRVLDKIHREGIANLTSHEKDVLRRASGRRGW
ncbi:MAG: rhomboid family intramembrane serine protease, partial [Planctomycetota bacterium]